jgi:L-lysine exporter family protein LysE/ArgO
MISAAPSIVLAGFAFGLSLIVVIGPQNAYLLRVGALGRGVLAVVAVCTLSDAALIVAGTAGAGAVLQDSSGALTLVRWAGAAFLLGYALLALRRAVRPATLTAGDAATRAGLLGIIGSALALTWLNPGVYLDTVVLLGSVAHTHGSGQWAFAVGAVIASAVWFSAIGFGARRLGGWLDRPTTWRVLDAFVALVMTVTAVRLLAG